ncbi:MAG: dTDP-glucose 4,6-dehydratase [Chthonomonadaceae bacterium]|nr:dTDP-glucose 4,6-dehydratase [Chthonomonadaceae bacterium]
MSKRIFVAGASGVIGRRLCLLLVQDGYQVIGTTRSAEKAVALRAMGVEPALVDVFDAEQLHRVVAQAQAEIVIHQLTDLSAGFRSGNMAEARRHNAYLREVGTHNLVAAAIAGGVRRMIAQSIAFAYAPGITPYLEDSPLNVYALEEAGGLSARAVASLEEQVLSGPWLGIVLRYGRLYGPGTGVEAPPTGAPVHVDAAADAARRAITQGSHGIYNVAEENGTVSSTKALQDLDWRPDFRIVSQRGD